MISLNVAVNVLLMGNKLVCPLDNLSAAALA